MFLEAKDPASLLALMGLHRLAGDGYLWRRHLMMTIEPTWEENDMPAPSKEVLLESINNDLSELSPRVKSPA